MGMTMTLFQMEQEILESILKNPETLFEFDHSDEKYNSVNIDKSWDGIKFLLSGGNNVNQKTNSSIIISSGQIIGEFDEYDIYKVNFLTAYQVKECVVDLEKITMNYLQENFDPKTMNEKDLYCSPFDETSFDYLFEIYKKVKKFYLEAEQNNKAVITYIS